jgi:hypothetical protein
MIVILCHAGVGKGQVTSGNPPAWFTSVHADLAGFRYPVLARQAQISGIVKLKVSPGESEITPQSGHPLLVAAAKENLAKWRFIPALNSSIFVEYVFHLTDPDVVTRPFLRGDALDRFFLRIFRQPVYRDQEECQSSGLTDVTGPKAADNPALTVRLLVTSQAACFQPSYSYLAARTD